MKVFLPMLLAALLGVEQAHSLMCFSCTDQQSNLYCLTPTICSSSDNYCVTVATEAGIGNMVNFGRTLNKGCSPICPGPSVDLGVLSVGTHCCQNFLCNISAAGGGPQVSATVLGLGLLLSLLAVLVTQLQSSGIGDPKRPFSELELMQAANNAHPSLPDPFLLPGSLVGEEFAGVCRAKAHSDTLICYKCFKVPDHQACEAIRCSPNDTVCISHEITVTLRVSLQCYQCTKTNKSEDCPVTSCKPQNTKCLSFHVDVKQDEPGRALSGPRLQL
ncbi:PREDICTED: uncharacterized protein LOC102819784 [Chrysochloris asiatica]|uniref:Uncharacterized protein LOC102819784 n=1 Tax=Chrysochloris asiatica TaxID=185453 RepID=A0A9B0SXN5_CHRAS|nr:PREDICTED: uncharacterized protein LOC102819784 [Chrysochloris asiatica]